MTDTDRTAWQTTTELMQAAADFIADPSVPCRIDSPAFDAVCAADHPPQDRGGPCATCAFRPGTEASQTANTVALARLCIEGMQYFECHERPGLCKAWIAAVNRRGAPETESDKLRCNAAADAAGLLSDAIQHGFEADLAAR